MDEDLSIINANTRNEKIKNFFVNNKKLLISSVIILVLIAIGVYSYDKYTADKKRQISDNFNAITIDHSENSKDTTCAVGLEGKDTIIATGAGTLSVIDLSNRSKYKSGLKMPLSIAGKWRKEAPAIINP